MLNKFFSLFVSVMGVVLIVSAQAKELPDFTDLVEKQGAAVVNISTTQIIRITNFSIALRLRCRASRSRNRLVRGSSSVPMATS